MLALLSGLSTNWAAAQEVRVQLQTQVRPGEHPTLTVTSPAAIAGVRVEVERDGKPLVVTHGAVAAGRAATLALPAGSAHYRGQVVTRFVGGTSATSDLTFDVGTQPSGNLKIGYAREHLDLDAHTLEFTLTKAATSADLKVIGDDGAELARAHADFHGEHAGAWLPIAWTPTRAGNVLALELHATSTDGSAAGVRLVPWSVHIAHEEVVFESGKAEIRPSEAAKLDASYQKIVDAVADVRKAAPDLPVRLFIAGHTDTVGAAADNRKLSLARARAIAAWYHDRGLPLPIAYAGFGEDALKRKTADNVDDAANRRVDYIVGVEEPQVAKGVRAPWYKLQ
ncbi:MAG TPA: OmpA family protein [Polyangia bacterium]|nr:OmpA family protein [Polyangia bacterium]